jgi:hypothetical protein
MGSYQICAVIESGANERRLKARACHSHPDALTLGVPAGEGDGAGSGREWPMKRQRFGLFVALVFVASASSPGGAQGFNQTGPFLGVWCAQGNPSLRASIAASGPFNMTLTNESGSTSQGIVSGPDSRQVTAPDWNLVQGNLSPDGQTISWSNNTFWSRCPRPQYVDVQGTWYVSGDQSRACYIDQRGRRLSLQNEAGAGASGSFVGTRQITTNWSGNTITGTIARSQNRIDWSNGTFWTR